VVTEPLREADLDPSGLAVIVGPPVLFRFAIAECLEKGLDHERIFVSLERNFQCGIGKCGHCQVNDFYVCQDGPVFSLKQLEGRTEATEIAAAEAEEN
jgi:NAD(P)H-flavin reductase